jgi:hypothetical protein
MYVYAFVYIVLPLIIIIKIIDFFVANIFPIFFHVHLNILDKVVSSLNALYLPMLLVTKCVTSEMLTESYKMAFPNVFCTRCTLIRQNN